MTRKVRKAVGLRYKTQFAQGTKRGGPKTGRCERCATVSFTSYRIKPLIEEVNQNLRYIRLGTISALFTKGYDSNHSYLSCVNTVQQHFALELKSTPPQFKG